MEKSVKFIKHIHYFRAFAIINILLSHIWRIPEEHIDGAVWGNLMEDVRMFFFHDSSIYFLFISGFLFYHLKDKTSTKKFYHNKLKNIVLPYLIINMMVLLFSYFRHNDGFEIKAFIYEYIDRVVNGSAQHHFWYIPFIVIVFVFAPFLLKVDKRFNTIALIIAFLPLFGSRTGVDVSIGQFIYFAPVFFLGAATSKNYTALQSFFKRKILHAIIICILSCVTLVFVKLLGVSSTRILEALFYIQKLSVIVIVLVFFQRLENTNYKLLNIFADYSFAIYFIHMLVYYCLITPWCVFWSAISQDFLLITSPLLVLITAAFVIIICFLSKKTLGKYSRFVIGA